MAAIKAVENERRECIMGYLARDIMNREVIAVSAKMDLRDLARLPLALRRDGGLGREQQRGAQAGEVERDRSGAHGWSLAHRRPKANRGRRESNPVGAAL